MRRISWFALFALSVVAGCNPGLSEQAKQLLKTGEDAYRQGDDARTVSSMNEFLASNARSPQAEEAYYYRGLARYRQKDIIGAQSDFNQVLSKGSPQFKAPTLKALGDIAYDREDIPLAESRYRESLANMDETKPPADEVRYRLAQSLQRLGRWTDADLQFSRVIYLFNASELARRSARQIHATAWTVQLAAMKDKRSADAMAADYRTKNRIEATVQAVQGDAGPIFAVQSGRYPTFDLAIAALKDIRAVNPNAFVTVTK